MPQGTSTESDYGDGLHTRKKEGKEGKGRGMEGKEGRKERKTRNTSQPIGCTPATEKKELLFVPRIWKK